MSRQKKYDEEYILKNTAISKQQLSNIKAHLYKQLLISLKLNPVHQSVPINIREQMDFAYILYRKGLYKQSLKILEKVKATALHYEEKVLAYDILEWEKIIESQYITRSTHNRAETLVQETKDLTELNLISGKLSNLSLQLYNIFLKMGHARTQEESDTIRDYFKQNLPEFDIAKLGFREKLWLYKAHLWYSFISQNFISCYRYSSKWIDLFKEYPHLISVHPVSYLKGNHYLLESLFYLNHTALFEKTLKHLEETLKDPKIPDDDNIATLSFLYVYSNKLNLRFMKGDFDNGDTLVEKIEKKIKKYGSRIDGHHIMIFYYKIASLYFGNGNYTKCIDFLKRIIDNKSLEVREDLMCFSRILNLVAHYEAGKDYHLESLVKSTYKFLIKMNDMHKVQKEMIRFLRNLPEVSPLYIKDEFRKLHSTLKVYEDHPYERRAFLYLDILSWLESRIEDRPVAEIIAEKVKLVSR
jgi:tetratricopeptide (TPR) repeat protein